MINPMGGLPRPPPFSPNQSPPPRPGGLPPPPLSAENLRPVSMGKNGSIGRNASPPGKVRIHNHCLI